MADIGPVEYAVIAFPGNQFKGEIVPATPRTLEHVGSDHLPVLMEFTLPLREKPAEKQVVSSE